MFKIILQFAGVIILTIICMMFLGIAQDLLEEKKYTGGIILVLIGAVCFLGACKIKERLHFILN